MPAHSSPGTVTAPAIAAAETTPLSQTSSSVSTASDTVPPIVAVVSVVLTKGKDGLGMTINSAADGSPGTYITQLTPGGVTGTALKAAGGLGVDDGLQIVEINEVDTPFDGGNSFNKNTAK